MSTSTMNDDRVRKSLADQIDRLDKILDGLAEGLNEAVADAVRQAVSLAVQEAVRQVLTELLSNPTFRAQLRDTAVSVTPVQAKIIFLPGARSVVS